MRNEVGTYEISQQLKGKVLGVRKVQNRGRVQIPKLVKEGLQLKDGDSVYWVRNHEGKYYILKATEIG